ncbi:MAG: P-loop NTPase fold protein [Caldilineaceae bacterium]|nr:P-loop NTPase fold protein [Caldilineaceae bacterium]
MSDNESVRVNPSETVPLKPSEKEVSSEEPWQDDLLGRKEIAERLTNLIRKQRVPLLVGIDGKWGTGKTFLLRRWQKDLESEGFRSIYYNAWEDDFCDDPFLAVVGQLFDHFNENRFKKLVRAARPFALALVKEGAIAWTSRLFRLDFHRVLRELTRRDILQKYSDQREVKERLREQLTKLSTVVEQETERPLVFIIDELDRCRPTFAIELLERVKHIFDVPNIVFVFGVNRDELCESLKSVYGGIDADVYLRKFFDLEFPLQVPDKAHFCRYLMRNYQLENLLSWKDSTSVYKWPDVKYHVWTEEFPDLCARFDLSLRDIDSCVRLMALSAQGRLFSIVMYPFLLAFLIALSHKDPLLYRQFLLGQRRASEVMNFVFEHKPPPTYTRDPDGWLDVIEAILYRLEGSIPGYPRGEGSAIDQLSLKSQDKVLTCPELLSDKTRSEGKSRAERLLGMMDSDEIYALAVTPGMEFDTLHGSGFSTIDTLLGLIRL